MRSDGFLEFARLYTAFFHDIVCPLQTTARDAANRGPAKKLLIELEVA